MVSLSIGSGTGRLNGHTPNAQARRPARKNPSAATAASRREHTGITKMHSGITKLSDGITKWNAVITKLRDGLRESLRGRTTLHVFVMQRSSCVIQRVSFVMQ